MFLHAIQYRHPLILCWLLGCLALLAHPEDDLWAVPHCSCAVAVSYVFYLSLQNFAMCPFFTVVALIFFEFAGIHPVFSSAVVALRHVAGCWCLVSSSPSFSTCTGVLDVGLSSCWQLAPPHLHYEPSLVPWQRSDRELPESCTKLAGCWFLRQTDYMVIHSVCLQNRSVLTTCAVPLYTLKYSLLFCIGSWSSVTVRWLTAKIGSGSAPLEWFHCRFFLLAYLV